MSWMHRLYCKELLERLTISFSISTLLKSSLQEEFKSNTISGFTSSSLFKGKFPPNAFLSFSSKITSPLLNPGVSALAILLAMTLCLKK